MDRDLWMFVALIGLVGGLAWLAGERAEGKECSE